MAKFLVFFFRTLSWDGEGSDSQCTAFFPPYSLSSAAAWKSVNIQFQHIITKHRPPDAAARGRGRGGGTYILPYVPLPPTPLPPTSAYGPEI